ncbi:MAG: hypothetical protein HON47_00255 [Candidatus Diapherotrites archaeon]|jgi:hypothetical protein|uniref:Arrestin C-terminal-like domain-containing protein n=1 Tax=Candidatus Iainarchaeum sp. TaxID=3101447 RepID=A0A8T5GDF0_9ARCH|nr:hypothetical protein [Candidatus Diapherotrites archaeon]MBT7241628.1 hypothetical protein [Candidatus Diapherotrites archaeon]
MFGMGKGKMNLILDKMNYAHGETINGKVNMTLKKPVAAKGVIATIFAETTQTKFTGNGMQKQTMKIFDFSIPLDGEREYSSAPYNYEFQITIPQKEEIKAPEGIIGGVAQAAKFLSQGMKNTKWFVEVKLDVPKGFDLRKKQQINVV